MEPRPSHQPHKWFKYVVESQLHDYERMGWFFTTVQYEGAYLSFIMEYRCCCRTFELPPTIRRKPK